MAKVKRCPRGHINSEYKMVCTQCDPPFSLLHVKATMLEKPIPAMDDSTPPTLDLPAVVPTTVAQMSSAGQPTTALTARARISCPQAPAFAAIVIPGSVIGRSGDIDVTFLPRSQHISNCHATFLREGAGWVLRIEGKTNPAYVQNHLVPPGHVHPLSDGDTIILGDTPFTFNVA